MSFVIHGANLHVKESGAGQPVLFLHGNPDSADLWDGVVSRLNGRFRCIAIDLPGFGRSTAPAEFDCSFENLGRFTDETVAQLGFTRPIDLVAHDFGGAYAMAWAAMHPEKVRRMVAINTPFFVGDYQWHTWARIWRTPILGELSLLTMSWPLFRLSMKLGSRNLSEDQLRDTYAYMSPGMKRMILKLYRAANPSEFRAWEPRMLAATARIPTLVLWGEHDPYIPSWVADRLGARKVLRFPDSGHWTPAEMPEPVAEAIGEFLGQDAT